mmetsp:Transcript_4007/g.7554  ORF Transcript_4007/g.7554 Transcript_4007/m.7554 type:complete len:334 (-) Transcript_4007:375-1376(-)
MLYGKGFVRFVSGSVADVAGVGGISAFSVARSTRGGVAVCEIILFRKRDWIRVVRSSGVLIIVIVVVVVVVVIRGHNILAAPAIADVVRNARRSGRQMNAPPFLPPTVVVVEKIAKESTGEDFFPFRGRDDGQFSFPSSAPVVLPRARMGASFGSDDGGRGWGLDVPRDGRGFRDLVSLHDGLSTATRRRRRRRRRKRRPPGRRKGRRVLVDEHRPPNGRLDAEDDRLEFRRQCQRRLRVRLRVRLRGPAPAAAAATAAASMAVDVDVDVDVAAGCRGRTGGGASGGGERRSGRRSLSFPWVPTLPLPTRRRRRLLLLRCYRLRLRLDLLVIR